MSCEVLVDEILTVTDRTTKIVVLIQCSSRRNAAEVTDNFWWEVVRYHGLPRSTISDRVPVFVSQSWAELMKFLDIEARRSSPYYHMIPGRHSGRTRRGSSCWAPIANTEYITFYLNFRYHPVFWWDLPVRQEPGPGARKEAVRGMVHRIKDEWRMVREAFKKEHARAAAYADRRRADYQFKKGQDVLINKMRHYRGQFGSDRGPLAPRALFRVKRMLTTCTLGLEILLAVRGRAAPVFHSSDLIPYETRVLDQAGMLPEVMPQEWTTTRWAQVMSEVYVIMSVDVSTRKRTCGTRQVKLAAVKMTKRRLEIGQRKMKKSYGGW